MALEAQEDSAIFTIVSNNYYHYAKTLYDSVKNIEKYKNTDFYILIVDKQHINVKPYKDAKYIYLHDLNISDIDTFLFRYNILEANTAVKPFGFEYLLNKYSQVTFFDPDIYVYKELDFSKCNRREHIGVLTPHITEPITDEYTPSENTFLKCGLYNLGFISLFKNYKTAKFINWWKNKLETLCLNDIKNGLFTDQKWIDLASVLFKDFYVCYDKTWNIAYWNLHEREGYVKDVTFFHFSGLKKDKLSIHQDRYRNIPECADSLISSYYSVLNFNNDKEYHNIRYGYDYFKNNSKIEQWQRDFYKTSTVKYDQPFAHSNLFVSENIIRFSDITNLGFYHNESPISNKYKWMEKCGYVKLHRGGIVRIRGYYDGYINKDNTISCLIDTRLVNTTNVTIGEFDITFTIPDINNQTLKIVSSNSFVPKQEKMGDDTRELSIKIRSISVDGEDILNFETSYIRNELKDKSGINVFGYGNTENGLGQLMRGFSSLDLPISNNILFDVNKKNTDITLKTDGYNPENYFNLFFINGDEDYCTRFPYQYFLNKYNIGYWCWELENLPDYWLNNEKVLQEIWCSSKFVQQSITKKSKLPCVLVPPVVEFKTTKLSKKDLSLPDKFVFLNIFDSKSFVNRKNPIDLINVFNQTFKNNPNVCLVIKTDESCQLLKEYEEKDKIIIINSEFDKNKIHSLQRVADCFVSLHRSEGFGFNIAESMYLGIPVIATDYSGNTDFCERNNCLLVDYTLREVGEGCGPYLPKELWAQPDLENAAFQMRKVYDNYESIVTTVGKRGRDTILANYSKANVLKIVKERLARIGKF